MKTLSKFFIYFFHQFLSVSFFLFVDFISISNLSAQSHPNSSILDVEFKNQRPNINLKNQNWTTNICGNSLWLKGDAPYEWASVLDNKKNGNSEIVGVAGTVLSNPHQSLDDVWFTHPFGKDFDFNMAWAVNPNFDFLQNPFSLADEEHDNSVIEALKKGFAGGILHVEIDSAFIPQPYRAVENDQVAVFGRWIVDCGHPVYQTEIHPPLMFVKASRDPNGRATFSKIIGRPYLISQDFGDGKTLRNHLNDQISDLLGKSFIPLPIGVAYANDHLVAKPNIASKPFTGTHWMIFYVRPPRSGEKYQKAYVSYNFTVRSGVTVTLFNVNDGNGTIGVNVLMDELNYIAPPLPHKREINIPINELQKIDEVKSLVKNLKGLGNGIGNYAINYVIDKGVITNQYDLYDVSEPSNLTIPADQINANKSVGIINNNQPFPIKGSIKVEWHDMAVIVPPTHVTPSVIVAPPTHVTPNVIVPPPTHVTPSVIVPPTHVTPSSPIKSNISMPYLTGNWSEWRRIDKTDYRFRWGRDPNDVKYNKYIDATFEMRNQSNKQWYSNISTKVCGSNGKSYFNMNAFLKPFEAKTFTLLTANCGSLEKPLFDFTITPLIKID